MQIPKLVPEVATFYRSAISRADVLRAREGLKHGEVCRTRLVEPCEQPIHRSEAALRCDYQIRPTRRLTHSPRSFSRALQGTHYRCTNSDDASGLRPCL